MSSTLLWGKLCKRLRKRVNQFAGVMGVSVKDIQGGLAISVNGGEIFPTASTIKIHVLTELLAKAERGELDLAEKIRVTKDLHVPGSGVLASMENEVTLSVLDIAHLPMVDWAQIIRWTRWKERRPISGAQKPET